MTTRFAALASLLALAPLLAACQGAISGQPAAVGPIPEILVVGDSTMWNGLIGEAIRAELGQPIETIPGNQGAFRLRLVELSDAFFPQIQQARHVVFAATIDDASPTGRFMRARLPEGGQEALRAGTAAGVYLRPDLWARNQLVVYATGRDPETIALEILAKGPEMRAAFNQLALNATEAEMFRRARQTDEEDALLRTHGWAIHMQHDYVKIQDTTVTAPLPGGGALSGQFVRYRRVLSDSWRDFFVFHADTPDAGIAQDTLALDALTNGLLQQFALGVYDGSFVQIDGTRPLRTETLAGPARPLTETRGIWRMTEDFMAGPFIRYASYDEASGRLYVYYGMVFAPDRRHDKREFLRQMEVVGRTLRTRADAASA